MKNKEQIKDKSKSLFQEFYKFISRGNVIDLAIGVVMGSAFTAIVTSLVNSIIMPIVGFLIKGVDFKEFKIILSPAFISETGEAITEVAISYGSFIQEIINFLIISFVVFLFIKALAVLKEKEKKVEKVEPPKPSEEVKLLEDIKSLLTEIKKSN